MGLTLPKAAQILDLNIKQAGQKMPPDVREAIIYGKQCIDRVQEGRQNEMQFCRKLLPFEISGCYE